MKVLIFIITMLSVANAFSDHWGNAPIGEYENNLYAFFGDSWFKIDLKTKIHSTLHDKATIESLSTKIKTLGLGPNINIAIINACDY